MGVNRTLSAFSLEIIYTYHVGVLINNKTPLVCIKKSTNV